MGTTQTLLSGVFTPTGCETFYTAGSNEVAIISTNVTLFNGMPGGTVFFAPYYTENNGGMVFPVTKYAVQTVLAGSSGTIHHQAVVNLVDKAVYRFRTDVHAQIGSVTFGEVTCRAIVTIAKRPS
jgi:hypothetical protein